MIQLETIDYSVENNISFADMMINDEMEENKSREMRDLMRQTSLVREAVEKGDWRRCRKCDRLYRTTLLDFEITTRIIMHYQVMK